MAVQTNYNTELDAGVAGHVANMVPATIISRTVQETNGIGFGLPTAQGTNDLTVTSWDSGDTAVVGITVRNRSVDANSPDEYADGDNAGLLTQGAIWVDAAVAVSAGDDVFVTDAGTFTNTSASGANVQVNSARWETSTSGAALAVVRID